MRGVLPVGLLVAALIFAGLAGEVFADFSRSEWRYLKAIPVAPGLDDRRLMEVTLDQEVFAGSAAGQIDLRVVREPAAEVPYQLVVTAGRRKRQTVETSLRDLGHLPGQHSSFVVDLGRPGIPHNRVEVSTASRNFQREVMVEASDDALTWVVLREDGTIFDFTVVERNFTARDTSVEYPESFRRFLRVSIRSGGEQPLDVAGALVASTLDEPAAESFYATVIGSRTDDAESGASTLHLDLGAPGTPTHRLVVQTAAVNFHRELSVAGSNDQTNWTPLAGGVAIYAFETPKFTGHNLEISYPESAFRYLRVIIENRDDPPLPVAGVSAVGLARKLIFEAEPGAEYSLYYGNAEARPAAYDFARVLSYLDTDDLPAANLGPQAANPHFVLPEPLAPPEPPASERYPWIITVAVIAAAIAVGGLLFGFIKQAKKSLPPPA